MEQRKDSKSAWRSFTRTGMVGAYLLYRAVAQKEQGQKDR